MTLAAEVPSLSLISLKFNTVFVDPHGGPPLVCFCEIGWAKLAGDNHRISLIS